MIPGQELVAGLFLATGAALLGLLWEPLHRLEKPGSTGFALAVIAISLWPLSLGVNYLVTDRALSMTLWNVRMLAAPLVSVGWLLLAYEFTVHRLPGREVFGLLLGYLFVGQLFAWTNPAHHLVLTAATSVDGGVLLPVYGPWFWAQTAVNYALIVAATALLAWEWVRSEGLRRRQAGILAVAVLPPVAANLLTIFEVLQTPHDLTPFGLVGSGLILSWALYRTELLDVAPVARETALEEMGDAVLTVDEEGRVVDCNRAARDLFGLRADYFGGPAEAVFAEQAPDILEHFEADRDVRTEVTVDVDGETRHFSLAITPVSGRRTPEGARVVVLRDVTLRKRREEDLAAREQELDLLRQVLTRVLRHNIRNELTTIRGNAELVAEEHPDERLGQIIAASDRLLRLSEETRSIERVVGVDPEPEPYDLARVVADVVEHVRAGHPDVTVEDSVPPDCRVASTAGLEVVVEHLVENAAKHNEGEHQHVRVAVTAADGGWRLTIADDGPGIPDGEIAVLEAGQETSLSHGSGLGLWVVTWWAKKAAVTVDFETGSDGTTVTLTFPNGGAGGEPPVD